MSWGPRRRGLASLALLASALIAAGCGSSAESTRDSSASHAGTGTATSHTALRDVRIGGYLRVDGDDDNDDQRRATRSETDEAPLLAAYGPTADPADRRAIATLARRYYAAALAGDGARVCALLAASVAAGLASEQGRGARGCAPAMSRLLAQQHQRLGAEGISTMTVVGARVKGPSGLVILGFRNTPETQMVLEREGQTWKIDTLLDSYMP